MENTQPAALINEHILEIRYKPTSLLLDFRGQLAAVLSDSMSLSEWRITQNRVDVHSKDESARVFVSHRNAGAVLRNTSIPDYFPNQANKFLRSLFSIPPFKGPTIINRIGVRSRFAVSVELSFEALLEQFQAALTVLTPEASTALGAEITDISLPLSLQTPIGDINFMSGPMKQEQLAKFFTAVDQETLPEVSLYVDLDYWVKPAKDIPIKKLTGLVSSYATENWERYQRILGLVLEE